MKKCSLALMLFSMFCGFADAGTAFSEKEVRQTSTVTQWYADNEWNVSLWGAYAFTQTENEPNLDLVDLVFSAVDGPPPTNYGSFDRYLGDDHAWGGGADIKYFFHRYFGIGIQGFALDAKRHSFDIDALTLTQDLLTGEVTHEIMGEGKITEHRVVGSILGTITFRYPISNTRFSPYAWAGVGAIFGGGERDTLTAELPQFIVGNSTTYPAETRHSGSRTELMGQFGGGIEFRFTPHIGWMSDFSWNVVNGADNDFGMARSGLNFAF